MIRAQLEDARRRLLDLTRRNRLLNFRDRAAGVIRIVDEDPEHVFRLLVIESRTMQLLAAEERDADAPPLEADPEDAPPPVSEIEASPEAAPEADAAPSADAAPDAEAAPSAEDETEAEAATETETAPDVAPLGRADEPKEPPAESPADPPAPASHENVTPPADHHSPPVAAEPTAGPVAGAGDPPSHAGADEPFIGVDLGDVGDLLPVETSPPRGTPEPPHGSAVPLAAIDEPALPADRHLDLRLQTPHEGERLQTRLLELARTAESALQEQGCNVLFLAIGMLTWTESPSSSVRSSAPLVLVPVELVRRSARQRHALRALDEEAVDNPVLRELCRRRFGLDLPAFDADADAPITTYLSAVRAAVSGIEGWSVDHSIALGVFSFAKLLMYLDLDPERWPAAARIDQHPRVLTLLGSGSPWPRDASDVDPRTLDDQIAPEDAYQVLDADSSQQAAIVGAKLGRSMVIQGPPGTGKSQTITNIISECLASGRTVLFVAEKAAALDVVKRRLEQVGLGTFVAALHSRKSSKRAFVEDLQRSLAWEPPPRPPRPPSPAHLRELRARLNEYARALHRRLEPIGITPYEAMGRAARLGSAPEMPVELPGFDSWDAQRLREVVEAVDALARAAQRTGPGPAHPWRGAALTHLTLTASQSIGPAIASLRQALAAAREAGADLARRLGAEPPETTERITLLRAAAEAIARAPWVDPAAAASPAWDARPAALAPALSALDRLASLRADLLKRWRPEALDTDWSAVLDRLRRPPPALLRFFSSTWRSDRRALREAYCTGQPPAEPALVRDLEHIAEFRRLRSQIRDFTPALAPALGPVWQEDHSNPAHLRAACDACLAARSLARQGLAHADALRAALAPGEGLEPRLRPAIDAADRTLQGLASARAALASLVNLDETTFLDGDPAHAPLPAWLNRLHQAEASTEKLRDWCERSAAAAALRSLHLGGVLAWCLDGHDRTAAGDPPAADPAAWPAAVERQFYRLLADRALSNEPALREFRGDGHRTLIERFARLDAEWIEACRWRVIDEAWRRRPLVGHATAASSGLGLLQAEIARRRNIRPIRRLLASPAGPAVQRIKPCFMMSPIAVAQFLEPGALRFDLVIFDEASQVEPADALGAVARAEQLILVGDDKQLPPTNFFAAITEDEPAPDDDAPAPAGDLESILALGQASIPLVTTLRWHYRSRHPSLIDFSNHEFYDRQLRVFPSPDRGREHAGLVLRPVEGLYHRGRGRFNPAEARAIALAVQRHAHESPDLSIGVGAFSVQQQRAIEY